MVNPKPSPRAVVDHVTAIVGDADAAGSALARLLGVEPTVVTLPGMAIRTLRVGEVELHVNAPTGPGPVQDHFRARGGGYHHLALRVDDLDQFVAECVSRGFRASGAIVETAPGLREVFLDPSTTGGVLVQLVERRAQGILSEQSAKSLDGSAVNALAQSANSAREDG